MKIYKFGNIPTGSIRGMQEMLQLVNDSTPKIIVLSAPTETTEHLTKIASAYEQHSLTANTSPSVC